MGDSMQDQNDNRQPSYPKTLGQILEGLRSPENPGIDVESACREFIGYWKGRGEARADWQATFRDRPGDIANYRSEREQRRLMDDRELETSLEQHFGSSRLVIRK
jgi:hypothetical protein